MRGCFVPHLPVVQRWWTIPVCLFFPRQLASSEDTCPPFCSYCSYQSSKNRRAGDKCRLLPCVGSVCVRLWQHPSLGLGGARGEQLREVRLTTKRHPHPARILLKLPPSEPVTCSLTCQRNPHLFRQMRNRYDNILTKSPLQWYTYS